MVLKVLLKSPPTLALVHGWLFPEKSANFKGNAGIFDNIGEKVNKVHSFWGVIAFL